MTKRGNRGQDRILVRSETVSEAEYESRRKRLLDVAHSRLAEEQADLFVVRAEVAAAAGDFYALVDWADERNAKRQSGDSVTALDSEGRCFRLVVGFMREMYFDYEVLKADPPTGYAYECVIVPPQGHLGRTVEEYRIEPLAEDRSAVTMTVKAYFDAGLTETDHAQAIRMMTVGAHNGLAKLKAYAEHGVGTVEAFESLELMPL